jgi:hypothetical protein
MIKQRLGIMRITGSLKTLSPYLTDSKFKDISSPLERGAYISFTKRSIYLYCKKEHTFPL